MSSLVDELFEDVSTGDVIKLTYGTSDSQNTVIGSFKKRTESLVTLVTSNGKAAKIRVDDIRSLDFVDTEPAMRSEHVPEAPAAADRWRAIALPPAESITYDLQSMASVVKAEIMSLSTPSIKQELSGAFDSYQSALKNNCLKEKHPVILAKITQIKESYDCDDEANRCIATFLGALSFGIGEHSLAVNHFIEANNYPLASFAADQEGDHDASDALYMRNLLEGKSPTWINQRLADICLQGKEIKPLSELIAIYGDDSEACERIVACGFYVLKGANFALSTPIDNTDSAIDVYERIRNSFPHSWQQNGIMSLAIRTTDSYSKRAIHGDAEQQVGTISSYWKLNDWGFINGPDKESLLFHSAQIDSKSPDSKLLLSLLEAEKADNVEVNFYKSARKAIGAQDAEAEGISLTDAGRELAEIRLGLKAVSSRKKKQRRQPKTTPIVPPTTSLPRYYASVEAAEASKAVSEGKRALLHKEFDIAEDNFQYVLEYGSPEQIAGIIGDCVTLYIQQQGRVDDALSILEQHGSLLSRRTLRNLLITVYEKKRDFTALIPLCEESLNEADTTFQKNHELLRLIKAHLQIGNYQKAIEVCDRWDTFFQQNQFSSDSERLRHLAPSIDRYKAICLYHLGLDSEAKKIARSLVQTNPSDATANAILDGSLSVESTNAANNPLFLDDALFGEDFGTSVQIIKESKFVSDQIDEIDIAIQQKYRVSEGEYVGDIAHAKRDVDALLSRPMQSPKTRCDTRLTACKIILQIESKCQKTGETSPWAQNYVIRLAGRAIASWGDFKASSGQLDTSRMAYLFALKVLTMSPKGEVEQDWVNSYNRYLRSFYLGTELSSYITAQQQERRGEVINTDLFVTQKLNDFAMPAFLVGVLNLVSALENQTKQRDELISDLYQKNPELRRSLCMQLSAFGEPDIPSNLSREAFKALIERASETLRARVNQLIDELNEVASLFMSDGIPEEMLMRLDLSNWERYLCTTDASRLQLLAETVIDAQNYYRNFDFDARSDCLRTALLKLKDLQQSIKNNPTELSYETMLPVISTMYGRIVEAQSELYRSYIPELTWEENVQPSLSPDGTVLVQLLIRNEVNHQAAEALTIDVGEHRNGDEIVTIDPIDPIDRLRGGESKELLFNVDLKQEAREAGSFTLRIPYSFRYKKTPQSITECNSEVSFSMVVRNDEGVPFVNPYKTYSGGQPIEGEDDEMFYGRETEKAEIVKMVRKGDSGRMNYGRAIAMYGQTRTGKSSLLSQIRNAILKQHEGNVLLCDMENIGEIQKDANNPDRFLAEFLYLMLANCCDSINENPILSQVVDTSELEPPRDMLKDPSIAAPLFNERMRRLNKTLIAHDVVILLIIDEFTYLHGLIRRGEVTSYFMQFWKALLQNYCVFAIVVGQDDMPEFMHEYLNEFACMELIKLTYLDEQAAKRLIHEPLERANGMSSVFQKAAIDEIYRLTAGSAFLTMKFCDGLVKYLNEKGARTVTPGIVEDFLTRKALGVNGFLTIQDFEPQLQERGHREYDDENLAILRAIAKESKSGRAVSLSRIQCEGIDEARVEMLLARLVDRNVLVKANDEYEIQVKLFERWLNSGIGV